jgi:hypothetical protein
MALQKLPGYGLVSCTVAFEAYMHRVLETMVEEVYQNNTFEDFQDIFNESGDILFQKVFKKPLQDSLARCEDQSAQPSDAEKQMFDALQQEGSQPSTSNADKTPKDDRVDQLYDVMKELIQSGGGDTCMVADYANELLKQRALKNMQLLSKPTPDAICEAIKGIFLDSDEFYSAAKLTFEDCLNFTDKYLGIDAHFSMRS